MSAEATRGRPGWIAAAALAVAVAGGAAARADGPASAAPAAAEADPDLARARAAVAAAPGAAEPRLALAELQVDRARRLAARAERAGPGTRRDAWRAEAVAAAAEAVACYTALRPPAESALAAAREAAEARAPEQDPGDDADVCAREREVARAGVGLAEALLEQVAASSGPTGPLARAAREVAAEMAFEFDGRLPGAWALVAEARAQAAAGRPREAGEALEAVLAMPASPAAAEVRLAAAWRLAELRLAGGDARAALAACEPALAAAPAGLRSFAAQGCGLARAAALAATAGPDAAIAETLRVLDASPPFHRDAALARLAGLAPAAIASGARAWWEVGRGHRELAEHAAAPEHWSLAIAAFQASAAGLRGAAPGAPSGADVWRAIGDGFFALERWDEAALAYGHGAERPGVAPEAAGTCAYWAFRAAQESARRERTPEAEARARAARDRFVTGWPDHPHAGNLPWLAAREAERAGDGPAAAAAFERLFGDARHGGMARARAAGCLVRAHAAAPGHADAAAWLDRAVVHAEAARRWAAEPGRSAASGADALATYWLARVAAARGDPAGVLARLDGFVARHRAAEPDLAREAQLLCLGAEADRGEPEAADLLFGTLEALGVAPEARDRARLRVVAALEKGAEADRGAGEVVRANARGRRALDLLEARERPDPSAEALFALAARLRRVGMADREAGRDAEARARLARAGARFEAALGAGGLPPRAEQSARLAWLECSEALGALADAAGDLPQARAAWAAAAGPLESLAAGRPKDPGLARRLGTALRRLDDLDGDATPDRAGRLARALAAWLVVVQAEPPYAPAWWGGKVQQLEILERQGRQPVVRALLDNLRGNAPDLGGPDGAERLQALARRAGLPWAPPAVPRGR